MDLETDLFCLAECVKTVRVSVRALVQEMTALQCSVDGAPPGTAFPALQAAVVRGAAALDDLQAFVQNRMTQEPDHAEMLAEIASLHEWALEHEEEVADATSRVPTEGE